MAILRAAVPTLASTAPQSVLCNSSAQLCHSSCGMRGMPVGLAAMRCGCELPLVCGPGFAAGLPPKPEDLTLLRRAPMASFALPMLPSRRCRLMVWEETWEEALEGSWKENPPPLLARSALALASEFGRRAAIMPPVAPMGGAEGNRLADDDMSGLSCGCCCNMAFNFRFISSASCKSSNESEPSSGTSARPCRNAMFPAAAAGCEAGAFNDLP
mmetsp:Transcript_7601/g.27884  ORF Transcript_7601/g.27884 Transcript_7601/m.27884 type:complete len:214 (-) Transcript_7601:2-643(-)